MGAKDNLEVRKASCSSCPSPAVEVCCRAMSGKGRRRWVLKCGEVLGNSAKSRGSSSISVGFLQTLVVVVVDVVVLVRPTEGGAPEEPAVEVGETLMLADKMADTARRGSYIFEGETPCLGSWKDDSMASCREPGEG
jgi:hypothetical protein